MAGYFHLGNFQLQADGIVFEPVHPGSPEYLSPEEAGSLPGVVVGPPALLYSCAAVLFRALTGQLPYADLRAQLTAPPPLLSHSRSDLPPVWEEFLQRLLQADPRRRYQRLQAVLDDLEKMQKDAQTILGLSDLPVRLHPPGFVLHYAQLDRLNQCGPGLIMVRGVSGSGKSRLLDEFARRRTGLVLHAQAQQPGIQRPLQLLDDLSREIAKCGLPLRTALADYAETLCAVLPALAPEIGAPAELVLEEHGEERTLVAVHELLKALGPCTILLDDLQWSDPFSLKLLERWHRQPGSALVVASMRSEQALETLGQCPAIVLPPLEEAQVQRVLASMVGRVPEGLSSLVYRCGQGNLFLSVEILRGMEESGLLRADATGWSLDQVQASRRAAEMLSHRLDSLPADSQRILAHAALLGRQFSSDLLTRLHPGDCRDALASAVTSGVLWQTAEGYRFAHDRLREHCLAALTDEERLHMHAVIADQLECQPQPDPQQMAYHLDQAGLSKRAFPYALEAGRRAARRYDLELAERNYRLALSGTESLDLHQSLGEVLLVRGQYAEAALHLHTAVAKAQGGQRARLLDLLGSLEMSRGQLDQAEARTREGLAALGIVPPRTRTRTGLALLGEVTRQLGHLVATDRPRPPACSEQKLAVDLLNQYSLIGYFRGDMPAMAWSYLTAMNRAERVAPTVQLAAAYAYHSVVLASLGRYSWARGYAEEAVQLQTRLGGRRGFGRALLRRAYVALLSGRLHDALSDYREGQRVLAQVVDPFEEAVALQNLICVLYHLGQFGEARALAGQLAARSREGGNLLAEASALRYGARLSGGRLESPLEPDPQITDQIRLAHLREAAGVACLYQGQWLEAAGWFEAVVGSSVHPLEKALPATDLVTAYRLGGNDAAARRALRQALKLARVYPLAQPHAWREKGLLAARRGRVKEARASLNASLDLSRRLHMRYQEALSLRARAECGKFFGWPEANDDALVSERLFALVGADFEMQLRRTTPSQLDRYQQLLQIGCDLAGSRQSSEVQNLLVRAGQSLFRVDKVELVEPTSIAEALVADLSDQSQMSVGISVLGKLQHCLRLSQPALAGLFGEEEQQLANFLAALAGAALENAEIQDELGASREHFRSLFQGTGLGIALLDAAGSVVDANETLRQRARLPEKLEELIHPDFREAYRESLASVLSGGPVIHLEVRVLEGALWGQLTFSSLDCKRAVVAFSDISQRKLAQVVSFTEAERRLLSSELHDVVSQPLAGLALMLRALPEHPLALRTADLCADLVSQMSSLMFGLRTPQRPASEGALQGCVLQFQQDSGCQASLKVSGDLQHVSELTGTFLYRIIQESLHNVRRHAQAQKVQIEVQCLPDRVVGWIDDDGRGFDPHTLEKTPRWGVRGMTERAELLGGWLRLDSSAGRGTRLHFELPVREVL